MKGKVVSRIRVCKYGHGRLTVKDTEIACPECHWEPKTYFIFFYHKGQKYRFSRDRDGNLLDSFARAKRLLENIRTDIDRGKFSAKIYLPEQIEKRKGAYLLDKWITQKELQGLSKWHTYKLRKYTSAYYLPHFGKRDMSELIRAEIDDFLAALPAHLSKKTKKNIMDSLRNFTRWLHEQEILDRIIPFPTISPDEVTIQWIPKEMQLRYLAIIPEKHRPIFTFLLHHPVRVGEACALQRKHFDLQGMKVIIEQAVGYKNEIKGRKNKKPYALPLSSRFDLSWLNSMLPEAYVFTNDSRLYNFNVLGGIWRRAIEKAKLPYINLYNASRHSIASQAINAGIPIDRISKALGHSTLEMTKRYASLNVEMMREIVDDTAPVGAKMVQQEAK